MNDYTYTGEEFDFDEKVNNHRRETNMNRNDMANNNNADGNYPRRRRPKIETREDAESGLPKFISRPIAFFKSRRINQK